MSQPELHSLTERAALGAELTDAQVEQLESAVLTAFLSELDEDDEPSQRGRALSDLLGAIAQLRSGFYEDAE